ncbi:hypothetical protein BH24ACT4_BH24ACT4_02740 [soil metagenome]
MLILLDSGPLGLLSNPSTAAEPRRCRDWMRGHLSANHHVVVAEIADYEVRRGLLRAGKDLGIDRLDGLITGLGLEPLTTTAMRQAAQFWADARQGGRPTAPDLALDGDVILAAQAAGLAVLHQDVVVATTNPKHLARFVPARHWTEV